MNEEESAEAQLQERIDDTRFKKLQETLCDEAGFLVDQKVQRVLNTVAKEQGDMMKVHNILKGLGVVDGQTFDALAAALSADPNYKPDNVKLNLVHVNDVILRLKVGTGCRKA